MSQEQNGQGLRARLDKMLQEKREKEQHGSKLAVEPLTESEAQISVAVPQLDDHESEPIMEEQPLSVGEQITLLSPHLLDKFESDLFREYDEQRLNLLIDSVRENGILSPLIVRSKGNRYELLSGRHRNKAALALGLDSVPCIIKNADDNEAVIIVTDSNLKQRENLLPSEKAHAYKMNFEAREKACKNVTLPALEANWDIENRSNCLIGTNDENHRTIYRYFRLTYLENELLELVDSGKLAIFAGEHLSYLDTGEQLSVIKYFIEDKKSVLDISTSKMLRERSMEVPLSYDEIYKLMNQNKKEKDTALKVKLSKLSPYLPPRITKKRDMEKYIISALEFYNSHNKEEASDEQG